MGIDDEWRCLLYTEIKRSLYTNVLNRVSSEILSWGLLEFGCIDASLLYNYNNVLMKSQWNEGRGQTKLHILGFSFDELFPGKFDTLYNIDQVIWVFKSLKYLCNLKHSCNFSYSIV